MNADCFLGLDLGQRMDRSAVALVRPTEVVDGVDWVRFEARRLLRLATGVGMPVVEMLRAADLKAIVVPVMITGGATAHWSEGIWFVPRRDLRVNLRGILERKELRIAAGSREGGHLIEEMANVFRSSVILHGGRFPGAEGSASIRRHILGFETAHPRKHRGAGADVRQVVGSWLAHSWIDRRVRADIVAQKWLFTQGRKKWETFYGEEALE